MGSIGKRSHCVLAGFLVSIWPRDLRRCGDSQINTQRHSRNPGKSGAAKKA